MQFPNAYRGVKKIYLGELMMLAVTVLTIATVIIIAVGRVDAGGELDLNRLNAGESGAVVGLAIAICLLLIIGFIVMLVGVINARKDDGNFRIALYAILLGIVIGAVDSSFGLKNPEWRKWFSVGISISSLCSTFYILTGIASLAEQMGDGGIRALAYKARNILLFSFAASCIFKLVSEYLNNPGTSNFFNVIGLFLELISFGFLLVVLDKGRKMLAG